MADDIAISVDRVSKEFILPHEKTNTIKSKLINLGKKKTYEHQKALSDVSFEVKKGEFFGIVGRNGSGKSTLLKILAGIYRPKTGRVHVNGKLIPFIELGVGFNPELSGRENVFLNGALLGFSREEMQKMYQEIVDFAELERFMDQKLKNYSSGMQVRLAFSIAVRAKGDILLIDEVLAVGDANFQQKCFNYFEELKRQRKTVVFVSHDMGTIKRFCTKAAYLEKGKITEIGTAYNISEKYVEANINLDQNHNKFIESLPKNNQISIEKAVAPKGVVKVMVNYNSSLNEDLFVGISVINDGISVGEISTEKTFSLKKRGKVSYELKTDNLNAGSYLVTAALFTIKNRELVAVGKTPVVFSVDGADSSRGGSLKLADGWRMVKNDSN